MSERKRIYLDNSATTMVAKEVVEKMLPYYTERYGNPSSLHSFGGEVKEDFKKAREILAESINAAPAEIIMTSGGSESNNLAIKGVAYSYKKKGNHIITSKIEHPSVLRTCEALEKEGFKVTYLGVDKEGFVSLEELEKAIGKNTILVSIMHANNEVGTIQDLDSIGELCRKRKVLLHSDTVQSYTKVPLDVKKTSIDLISMNSHKIHGPKGVGALYVRQGVKLKRLIDGGGQERRMRAGTENVPGVIGFAKAVELARPEHITEMARLRDKLIEGILREVPKTRLNGPKENRLCNNANISFSYIEGEALLAKLDMDGIAVSSGSACSALTLEPSHVLMALRLPREALAAPLRFSLSRYTSESEVDYTIERVKKAVSELRRISPLK